MHSANMKTLHFCHIFRLTLLCVVAAVFLAACSQQKGDEMQRLDSRATAIMGSLDKTGLDSVATQLLALARESGEKNYEARAYFYLAHRTYRETPEQAKRKQASLERALRLAEEVNNDTLLCIIYNMKGAWELPAAPYTAQYWFSRSLESADKLKSKSLAILAEMNMSEVCRTIGDTLGFKYDRELFEYAREKRDTTLLYNAGMHCALNYLSSARDTAELRPYIDAIRMTNTEYSQTAPYIYSRYFLQHDDLQSAWKFARMLTPRIFEDFMLLYAELYALDGNPRQSELYLDSLMSDMPQLSDANKDKVLSLRADNAAALGLTDRANSILRQRIDVRDSLDRLKNLDLVKMYKVKYDVSRKDMEIVRQKASIRSMVFGIVGIVILLVGIVTAYTLYLRRRNAFYRDTVRQYRDSLRQQNMLRESIELRDARIAELEGNTPAETPETSDTPADTHSGRLSEERAAEIFDKIQTLVETRQVWRDPAITREAFADMVGCNRTYFSEVLKEKTGMNYSQFMNSCRIREALRVLSDPADNTPLKDLSTKLGFMTIGTFYSAFRQNIGMPPAAYRKAARQI